MATVIRIANFFNKYNDKEDVKAYIESQGEDWSSFVEGELKKSNDTNSKSLGGQQPRHSIGDEDDNSDHYEVNMEKIMQRFSNFNSLTSSNDDNNDDDDNEDNKHDNDLKGAEDRDEEGGDDMFKHLEQQSN